MHSRRLIDFMQNYRFWLFDLVPSAAPPFFVLGSPAFGFSSISAPEYTANVDEIKQGNSMFTRHAYSGGSVGTITLARGVRGFDGTMWDWMHRAIKGLEITNRHMVLLHYTNINILRAGGSEYTAGQNLDGIDGPLEIAGFIPGKAWILWSCIPTRYRAGSGFDAMSGDVSIAELDIQPDAMVEITLLDPF